LLGLPFDALDLREAVVRIRSAAERNATCFLSTPNVNWVVNCSADPDFRDSVINSDISVVDGMPLLWVARLLRIPIKERVPGSTLFDLLRTSGGEQLSAYFFGGQGGVAEMACQRLRDENAGVTCAGFEFPGFGSVEDMSRQEAITSINESKADLLVVALGAKKGQAWIERNRTQISVPVICHLGAVVSFVAGTVSRAPMWMRRIGLEWLWRIKEEPALWRRYFWDAVSLTVLLATRVLPYAWYLCTCMPDPESFRTARVHCTDDGNVLLLRLAGAWSWKNDAPLRLVLEKATRAGRSIRVDLAEVDYIDSAFVGLLVLLFGEQRRQGRSLEIVSATEAVLRTIRYCCAEYLPVAGHRLGQ
jgi:N-acetylglucosaminyldiphosphoundecaprenol N-acetyl-beta-D-mannosaminyltransferase